METHTCPKCLLTKTDAEFQYFKGERINPCRDCRNVRRRTLRAEKRLTNPRRKRITEDCVDELGRLICTSCGQAKDRSEYPKQGYTCNLCRARKETERRRLQGIEPKKRSLIVDENKLCLECETFKHLSEFSPSKRGLGGVSSYCKNCVKRMPKNRQVQREATAKYRKNNRETYLAKHRLHQFYRKHQIRVSSDSSITADVLKGLYNCSVCYYCQKDIEPPDRTLDHKIPLSKNGTHSADNIVMACNSCNCSKRDLTEEEFKERLTHDRSKSYT